MVWMMLFIVCLAGMDFRNWKRLRTQIGRVGRWRSSQKRCGSVRGKLVILSFSWYSQLFCIDSRICDELSARRNGSHWSFCWNSKLLIHYSWRTAFSINSSTFYFNFETQKFGQWAVSFHKNSGERCKC